MCTTNCYNNFFIPSPNFLALVLIDLLICQLNIIQFALLLSLSLSRRTTLSKVLDTAQWFFLSPSRSPSLLASNSLPPLVALDALHGRCGERRRGRLGHVLPQ